MKKRRMRTISSKMSVLFILFALMMCLGLCVVSALGSWNQYTDFFWEKSLDAALLAASYVDGDRIGSYIETGETDEYYDSLREQLCAIKRTQNIKYLYIFIPGENSFTYVMDAQIETDDPDTISSLGDVYAYTEVEYQHIVPDIASKRASSEKLVLYQNAYGPGVSAWAPVLDRNGNVAAMVEADMALAVVVDALKGFLYTFVLVSFALIIVLVLILIFSARRMVGAPIAKLTREVQSFAGGEALSDYESDIHTGDEMETLSDAFAQMSKDIGNYTRRLTVVAAEREREAAELNLATSIQASTLPKPITGREEFGIFAATESAREIGGDFYDFFLIDNSRLCIVTADVSGKGIPAALFMVIAKTTIKNQMLSGGKVAESVSVLNRRLYESTSADMRVTAFIGVMDLADGTLSYVNAGQMPPFLMRKGGIYEPLEGQKMSPLAEMENVTYRNMELHMRQGDRLLLYTDGLPSAHNKSGETLGSERLLELMNTQRMRALGTEDTVKAVSAEAVIFEDGAERYDDITILALDYLKGDRKRAEISLRARADCFPEAQSFLKKQLDANGMGGAFYAELSVALEEAFQLAIARVPGRSDITVRVSVDDTAHDAEIALFYGSHGDDPLAKPKNQAEEDAVRFLKQTLDNIRYDIKGNINAIYLIKSKKD